MKKAITILMIVSLVGNIVPVFNIVAIACLVLVFLFGGDSPNIALVEYGPETARKLLLIAYAYWIASYFLTGASLVNFFSYDFLRFDGALLTAYLPLLFIADLRLDPQSVRRLLGVFLTGMSLVALLGLGEFIDITSIRLGLSRLPEPLQLIHDSSLTSSVFHGLFRAHNAAGAAYAMAALLAFGLLVHRKKPSLISWPACWLGLNVTGLMLTQSRTAYVSFFATAALMFFSRRDSLKIAVKYGCPILIPLLGFLFLQPTVSHRTEQVSDLEDPNIVMRFTYYQRAIADFERSPLVGIGFARYNDEFKTYSGVPHLVSFATGGSSVNDDKHAHNSYLHFLAEGGIAGLSLMLGVWVAAFLWVRKQKRIFEVGSFGYSFAQGIQACVVLEFFISVTEHMMGTAVTSLTVFTMLGLLLNLVGWKYRVAAVAMPHVFAVRAVQPELAT